MVTRQGEGGELEALFLEISMEVRSSKEDLRSYGDRGGASCNYLEPLGTSQHNTSGAPQEKGEEETGG